MKIAVGPYTITVDGSAWFKTFRDSTPIYHAWSPPKGGPAARTRCGMPLADVEGEGAARTWRLTMTVIPPRLATRIGRPCTRCWPELRNQESLFKRARAPRDESTQEVLQDGD